MRKLILAVVALFALPLAACDTLLSTAAPVAGVPSSPVVVADKTVLDEKVGIAVETAYKAWRVAVELGIDAGFVKGAFATKLAAIDNRAYTATLAVQAAYKAGNSAGYIAAAREANAAIRLGVEALRTKGQ
jgi:hypothetical protein